MLNRPLHHSLGETVCSKSASPDHLCLWLPVQERVIFKLILEAAILLGSWEVLVQVLAALAIAAGLFAGAGALALHSPGEAVRVEGGHQGNVGTLGERCKLESE